jgi:hypothetical protein
MAVLRSERFVHLSRQLREAIGQCSVVMGRGTLFIPSRQQLITCCAPPVSNALKSVAGIHTMPQLVYLIKNEVVPAGNHLVSFDGNALSSGLYVYRLASGSSTESRRMMLLK